MTEERYQNKINAILHYFESSFEQDNDLNDSATKSAVTMKESHLICINQNLE